MDNFFTELKRRHIYRVAAAYVVVAWMLVQVVSNIGPMLKLPDWIGPVVIVFLLVGFPVTLIFAWIHHLASAEGTERAKSGIADWLLTSALAVVIALIVYEQIGGPRNSTGAQQASVATAIVPASQPNGISIAVLPFANVSGDSSQEFFSDGMTDEIIAALAKVPSLRVVARTSAFQFKGEKKDMRAIGQALNARYLIDGSVRKAGDRVRITAQLVQADNGVGVWTQSYDRDLKDIFATQSDIAEAIAGALKAPLGLAQGDTLVRDRTKDLDSYDQYLRARALFRKRSIGDVIRLLEATVARDPTYAPAWGLLARAYRFAPSLDGTSTLRTGSIEEAKKSVQTAAEKAETTALKAILLDPRQVNALVTLALIRYQSGKQLAADDLYRQALGIDPNDPDLLFVWGTHLMTLGKAKEARDVFERMLLLEPSNGQGLIAFTMAIDGQYQAALRYSNL